MFPQHLLKRYSTVSLFAVFLSTSVALSADFDADVVDIWLSPSDVNAGESGDVYAKFKNLSDPGGPYGGAATFDARIIVTKPSGSSSYGYIDNWSFDYYGQQKDLRRSSYSFSEAGTYTVKAEIYDVNGYQSGWSTSHRFDYRTEYFTLSLPDHDPVASRESPSQSSITLEVGSSQTFVVRATDQDGNLDFVEWYRAGSYRERDEVSGSSDTASHSETFSAPGTYGITAVVFDDRGNTDQVSWSVQVVDSNHDPVASRQSPSQSSITLEVGSSQTFVVLATDQDGNLDFVEWYRAGSFKERDEVSGSSDTASRTETFSTPGTYGITAVVFDDKGAHHEISWSVQVGEPKRGMYVDYVYAVLGSRPASISLLEYAKQNGITYLAFYISADHPNINPPGDTLLTDFVQLAKTSYGIQEIGLIGSSTSDFDKYVAYNSAHPGAINVLNLEKEFWNSGDFATWKSLLQYMSTVGTPHGLLVEAYIGWPTRSEMLELAGLVDRLFIHAYVTDASSAYGYTRDRLLWAGESGTNLTIWPIYSAESSYRYLDQPFMGDWLKTHGLSEAENLYLNAYASDTDPRRFGVSVAGFQYYSYQVMSPLLFLTATSFSPEHGASGIPVESNLQVSLGDLVTGSGIDVSKGPSGNITIKRAADGTTFETIPVADSRINVVANVVTINPSAPLQPQTQYCVVVDSTCFRSAGPVVAGSPYPGISVCDGWTFTTEQSFTIAGRVTSGGSGLAAVTISGLPGSPVTNANGDYSATVEYGWSGTATPSKAGYSFSPPNRSYSNVTSSDPNEDYTGTHDPVTISGYMRTSGGSGINSVTVSANNGAGSDTTDGSGRYDVSVPYGWSGRVTPSKADWTFSPPYRDYSDVTSNQSNEDYTGTQTPGSITVDPNPDHLNAPWTLTGPGGYSHPSNGDETISDLPPGDYTLTWGNVTGWTTPSPNPDTKNLSTGGSITFSGTYTQQPGTITVDPNPDSLNAPWTLAGPSGYSRNGTGDETVSDLKPGPYTLTWEDVACWTTPAPSPETQTLPPAGSISFEGTYEPVADPEIASWEIAATHGASEIHSTIQDGQVEPRSYGIAKLRICFNQAMDTSVTDPRVVAIVGTVNGDKSNLVQEISWADDTCMLIMLSPALPDEDTYNVTMSTDVQSVDGCPLGGDCDTRIGALIGDVNSDGLVDNSDMIAVRVRRGESVSEANCRYDVNCSGVIDNSDLIAIRVRRGNQIESHSRFYVDVQASGDNNGSTWFHAFTDLQAALDAAHPGDEIWVASGQYLPTAQTDPGDPRTATFPLVNGVAVYGGFTGDETNLDQKDPVANETILSGDINAPGNASDNSYHVVTADSSITNAENTVLDGFTITAGNADGAASHDQDGAGIRVVDGAPTLKNCTFTHNTAGDDAGGMKNQAGNPTLINCTFSNNSVSDSGGAIYNQAGGHSVLINCRFLDNTASDSGGSIRLASTSSATLINCLLSGNTAAGGGALSLGYGSSAVLTNCTLAGNSATGNGGGIIVVDSSLTMVNCILWGNTDSAGSGESSQVFLDNSTGGVDCCCLQGWTGTLGGAGNIGDDPVFADADLRCPSGKPA